MLQGRYGKYQFDQLKDQKCLPVLSNSPGFHFIHALIQSYMYILSMKTGIKWEVGTQCPWGLRFMNIVGYMDTKVQQVRTRSKEMYAFCGFYYWSSFMAFVASELLTDFAHLSCESESLCPCESSIAAQRTGQKKDSFKNIMWAYSSLHHWYKYRTISPNIDGKRCQSHIERWESTHCVQNVWPARFRR